MYITFENNIGSIRITGGGGVWQLIEVDGLGGATYDVQTAYIKGREGRVTSSLQSLERSISLKGDITAKDSMHLVTQAGRVLDSEGRLKIEHGTKKRMINARCTAFIPEMERGGIRPFVMQFVCDDPFFTDFNPQVIDVATVEKLLYGTLDLTDGVMFSTGRTKAVINNMGVKKAEPVVEVSCNNDMTGDVITITNPTTNQLLNINYSLKAGDKLKVDIPKRTVELNGEQRFDILSTNSFLSDFYLAPDKNQVEITTNHPNDRLTASIIYNNRYNEAIV